MTTVVDTSLLTSALAYAEAGWRVFPVGLDKRPLTPHGFQDATTHEGLIREWFNIEPQPNIALDIPEDIVILDFDPRNGAPPVEEFNFHATQRVETPSGGTHLYFRVDPGVELAGKWMQGIDVKRGGKGYVLLPPSRREDGRSYEWYYGDHEQGGGMDLILAGINELPTWVQVALQRQEIRFSTEDTPTVEPTFPWELGTRYGTYGLEQQLGHLAMAREGDRNNRLNKVGYRVGQLAAAGELKEAALYEVAHVAEMLGLEKDEVYLTLKSSYEAGTRRPWQRGEATD
jgi:hypothetical protein